jgi:YHS domain-containing protein
MRKTLTATTLTLAAALLAAPWTALAADKDKKAESPKPYPLDTCVVTDEALGGMGEPYVFIEAGREIKLCCKSCLKDFNKNKAKMLAKVDAAASKVKAYPLDTCLVSGDKLGGMGDPYAFVRKGQEGKLCCKACLKEFDKSPATYLKKLETPAR